MKRPFVITGIFALIISAAALSCSSTVLLSMALCLAILALLFLIFFRNKLKVNSNTTVMLVALTFIIASAFFTIEYAYAPASRLEGTSAEFTATVVNEPSLSNEYAYYVLKGSHPLLKRDIKCAFPSQNLGLEIGDRVNVTLNFEELSADYRSNNLSDGIFISTNIESVNSTVKSGSSFYTALGSVRLFIKDKITNSVHGDGGALLTALLTGDRSLLSDELYNKTKTCGVTHILVVSGLHLGILSGVVLRLFGKMKLRRKNAIFLIFLLLCAVIAICDFHTSAIRSGVMSIIMLSASLINRKADPLNSLGFAVTVMTIFNPFIAGSAAFLLSVFATLGVIFVAPMAKLLTEPLRFEGRLSKYLNGAVDVIIVSISALVCVFPITVYYYGYTSLLSPIVTVFIGTAVEVALVLTAAGVLLAALPIVYTLSAPIIFIAGIISRYLSAVISLFGSSEIFVLVIDPKYTPLCFVFTAAVILVLWVFYRKAAQKQKERKDVNASERKGSEKLT